MKDLTKTVLTVFGVGLAVRIYGTVKYFHGVADGYMLKEMRKEEEES